MGAAILQDLVVVMVVAAATTIVSYRLRQPVVVGYLFAGVLIGPHTPPFQLVADAESIDALAELGVIFLMFALGLEFNLRKLKDVGGTAFVVGAVELGVSFLVGHQLGLLLGWGQWSALFLGAVVAISSTTLVVKLIGERGLTREPFAQVVFGVLIVEDVVAIVLVALLAGLGAGGGLEAGAVASTVAGVGLFALIAVGVGIVLVPRLIDRVSRFHVEEVLVITVVGIALGGALAAERLGFSVALGAFLMGAVISESRATKRVVHKVAPLRDLFTAVFFVATGMLLDPHVLWANAPAVLAVAGAVILAKTLSVAAGVLLAGRDAATAFRAGASLAQIGEFSFVIAALGLTLGLVRTDLVQVVVAASAVTALASPLLLRGAERAAVAWERRLPEEAESIGHWYRRTLRRVLPAGRDAAPGDERRAARLLVYAAWLLGVLIAGAYASSWFGDRVGADVGDDLKRAGALLVVGLAGLPFFIAFAKAAEAQAHAVARRRGLRPHRLASHRRGLTPRAVARAASVVAALGLLAIALRVAWGVHAPDLPRTFALVPVLAVLALVAWRSWRSGERVYAWMEETLDTLLDSGPAPPGAIAHAITSRAVPRPRPRAVASAPFVGRRRRLP